MESNLYHYSLKDYLSSKHLKIPFGTFEINEGEICILSYFYVHSKTLLLTETIKDSCQTFDSVLFLDLNFSVDFESLTTTKKVLKYEIFNSCELLMYLKSLHSFIKDSKMRTLVVIDSWNTYLGGNGFGGKILSEMIEKKCWETIFKLNKMFTCTFLICKKVNNSVNAVNTRLGKFGLIQFEDLQGVRQFGLLDANFAEDCTTLYHALIDKELTKVCIFTYPFKWLVTESLQGLSQG